MSALQATKRAGRISRGFGSVTPRNGSITWLSIRREASGNMWRAMPRARYRDVFMTCAVTGAGAA
jgi:hypothetical protein